MAKATIIEIINDLDNSKNAEEVSFSFRGTDYTVDLGKKNLAALEKALKPYIEATSRVSKGPARTASLDQDCRHRSGPHRDSGMGKGRWHQVVRTWPYPKAVREQYDAAHDK